MTNHEKLKVTINAAEYKNFSYKEVKQIANKTLKCTADGKTYATLRFLQEFCFPIDVSEELTSNFRNGDPRKFNLLGDVKNKWEFAMTTVKELTKSISTDKNSTVKKASPAPSSSTIIESKFSNELVENLVAYLINYKESLSKIYQWSSDNAIKELIDELDVKSKSIFDGENSPFEKTFKFKNRVHEILNGQINEEIEKKYIKLIISDWGGIKIKNVDTLHADIKDKSCKLEGIASRSKYYSFSDPKSFAIYDARVIYSLNWLLLKYESNIFFPAPSGRNTLMNPLDYTMDILLKCKGAKEVKDEISFDIYKRETTNTKSNVIKILKNGFYIKKNHAYKCYCDLLKRLANKLYGDTFDALTKTEMILFAIADKDIALDVFDHKYNKEYITTERFNKLMKDSDVLESETRAEIVNLVVTSTVKSHSNLCSKSSPHC